MKYRNRVSAANQQGAVLVVSLIMLAVMSLFVISMLKTSIIELKIGGASHNTAINFSNAEVAINKFVNDNNDRFAPGFLGTNVVNTPPTVDGGTVVIVPTQIACSPPILLGTTFGAVDAASFDVRATATGNLGGTTVMHQGLRSLAAAGACAS